MDAGLLHKAMYEVVQPNGLLVFRDPARTTGTSVTFDPDGSGSKLQSFPARTSAATPSSTPWATAIRATPCVSPATSVVTSPGLPAHRAPAAGLRRRRFRALEHRLGQYLHQLCGEPVQRLHARSERHRCTVAAAAACRSRPQDALRGQLRLADLDASTLAGSAGVIRVSNGATWRTAETTGADFMLVDNGTLALEGGALRTPSCG